MRLATFSILDIDSIQPILAPFVQTNRSCLPHSTLTMMRWRPASLYTSAIGSRQSTVASETWTAVSKRSHLPPSTIFILSLDNSGVQFQGQVYHRCTNTCAG